MLNMISFFCTQYCLLTTPNNFLQFLILSYPTFALFQVHPGALKHGGAPLVSCCISAAEMSSVSACYLEFALLQEK